MRAGLTGFAMCRLAGAGVAVDVGVIHNACPTFVVDLILFGAGAGVGVGFSANAGKVPVLKSKPSVKTKTQSFTGGAPFLENRVVND
jgi:hypothetical protein